MISLKKFRGTILILAASVLLILTLGAVLLTYRSMLGSKILANRLDSEEAFSIAEEAFLIIERDIIPHISIDYFNSDCNNGYCFSGENKELTQECITTKRIPSAWEDIKHWQKAEYHQELNFSYKNNQVTAKYIIEFLCYIPKDTDILLVDYNNLTDMAMLFRITVLGINNNGAESMQQSIYKRNIL